MDAYTHGAARHCTIDTLQETLDEYGYAVLPNVIDATTAGDVADELWHYLEHISQEWEVPIRRAVPSTWKRVYDLIPSHSMLMQHFEIGHSPAAWKVRQHPDVVEVFAKLHACRPNELLASFDGASIGLPPEVTGRGWQKTETLGLEWHKHSGAPTNGRKLSNDALSHSLQINEYKGVARFTTEEWRAFGVHDLKADDYVEADDRTYFQPVARAHWLHSDQSFARNGRECYQAWVTARDVGVGDATLVVLEGSHRLHGAFAEAFFPDGTAPKDDWHKLGDRELAFYRARCPEVRITCPAGSMVLWDSRTIHQGGQPFKGRAMPRERAIVYVCYQPVTALPAKQRAKAIQKKRRAFLDKRMTTHWPLKSKLFGRLPQHYGKGLPAITPIVKAIGLAWERMPPTTAPPRGKIVLHNKALSEALSTKLELTPDEWKAMGVKDLTHEHVVRVGEDYLKPVDETLELTPLGRALAGFAP